MKFPSILLIVCLTVCGHLAAQQEASNWYFGQNAGLKFDANRGTVRAVTDGQLNTLEGCTSISDPSGNLLFYSDGRTVWNRNHQIMSNASEFGGTGLKGDNSSTSSGLIVPKPLDSDIYYIFTVDEPHHFNTSSFPNETDDDGVNNGLMYSRVDIRLNDGLGNVDPSEKNIPLITYNPSNQLESELKCSEKITAVRADDCSSFWVLTHFVDKFYAFKVTTDGVESTPIVSTVGPTVPANGYRRNALGYLKASPDGTKLVAAHFGFSNQLGVDAPGGIYLFDFDSDTGVVSNSVELLGPASRSNPYGVEFSSENKKVYATTDFFVEGRSEVLQWDLESDDIPGSMTSIHSSSVYSAGALQLGIDKRIYRAQVDFTNFFQSGRYLGVIQNPELDGNTAGYREQGILLDVNGNFRNIGRIGLPPFIQSLFNTQIDIIQNGRSSTELRICRGDSYTLLAEDLPGASYVWSKDGVELDEDGSQLVIDEEGFYELYIEPNNGECPIEGEAVVSIDELPEAVNTTLVQCEDEGSNDGRTMFNLNEAIDALTNSASNRSVTFYETLADLNDAAVGLNAEAYQNTENGQSIFALVTDTQTGCSSTAQLQLMVSSTALSSATLELCDTDGSEDGFMQFDLTEANSVLLQGLNPELELSYYESYEDALSESNPLASNYTNSTAFNQIIYARAENENACFGINEIQLTVFGLPQIETDDEVFYCLNFFPEPITLDSGLLEGSPSDFSYQWSTGETTERIQVNEIGSYTVRVFNSNGCFKERRVVVSPSNIATINDIEVRDASATNTITVLVSGEGTYQYALDNIRGVYQDSNVFENVSIGFHTVYVRDIKNNCGIVDGEVSVIGFPKYFTPNDDGFNDRWNVAGLSEQFQPNTKVLIFDRFGKLLKQLNPLGTGWDGTFNGNLLPNSDYWFSVRLEDGRQLKGHFTLKR